jgi:Phage-related tail fibre protein
MILNNKEKKSMELLQAVMDAAKEGDEEKWAEAMQAWCSGVEDSVMDVAQSMTDHTDAIALEARGMKPLTAEETKYYERFIEASKSATPKQSIEMIDEVLPMSVFDRVFEDLTEKHPLLDAIRFENTGALTRILLGTSEGVAGWGDLCAPITDELQGGFDVVELTAKKLSAFMVVCNAMLDLGPIWLDRFVRTILSEALAAELTAAIVDGDGKDGPRGMTRMLTGDTGGVFPRKTAKAITHLDPETIGGIISGLSQNPNGKERAVTELLFVVNLADYYTKVFPATTPRGTDGAFRHDVMPFPTNVIPAVGVPSGHAIMGIAEKYFMGIGTAKGGKLEYADETKFLEDERAYRIKLYGNGTALDENAFAYLNIANLEPVVPQVQVVE